MYEIREFEFNKEQLLQGSNYRYGDNWPVVYILEGQREAYIGQSATVFKRVLSHLRIPERETLSRVFVIADDEYNKSATLDIEAHLIKSFAGDGKYLLQNQNDGMQESDYYDRERYLAKFELIWNDLREMKIVEKDLLEIENSDLFKYSPYKVLSDDQSNVVNKIMGHIQSNLSHPHLVVGEPGTGKTIVATYLMKLFKNYEWSKGLKIGLVIPMTSLRSTLKRVFKGVKGLSSGMVIGPNDVVKDKYDILVVDEAHRLQRRKNITNYSSFDSINKKLGLRKKEGTQLDWIMKSSKHQILFYDPKQSIKPADIRPEEFDNYNFTCHVLQSQMRVKGGEDYLEYITNILNVSQTHKKKFTTYDVRMFEDMKEMVKKIKDKDRESGLARMLAGYAWKWETRKDEAIDHDIEIDGVKLKWNSVTKDWVNSKDAINEVGCIHTIQGYDLNYAGVIIGPEMSYDKKEKKIVVDKLKYLDFNGKRAITDPEELEIYIKNIYKTMLTRGIKGTYLYAVDEKLRDYFKKYF